MVSQPDPAQFVMVLKGMGFPLGDLGQPDPHGCFCIQRPPCRRFTRELGSEADPDPQLLPELPVEGGHRGFAGLHLSTGKFPHAGELLGGTAAGHQHPGGLRQGIHHGAAHYLYQSSHRIILWGRRSGGPAAQVPVGRGPTHEGEFHGGDLPESLKSRHMSSVVETPVRPKTSKPNVAAAIFALAMGGVGIGVTEFTMMGLLKEVEQGLNISTPEAGHLISAYALGVVVGAPLLAAVGARLPRKHLALGLMLFFTLANLLSYIAPDYGMMLVSRFAAGLPHGAFFGVAAVIAASLVPPTRRGWAISMVMAGLSVSNVIGVPVATWVGQTFGWRLLFLLVGGIGLLTLFLLWRFVPFQAAHPDASIRRELGALRRVQVWLAILIGVVGFGGFFATYTYIAHTMTLVAGIPSGLLPVVVALYGLGMVAGTVIGGRLADRSVMGTLYWVLPGIAVALVVYAVAAHWPWSALVMVFVVGASGSLLIPALQTRLLDASPDAPSLASSLNHAALNVANALGAFLGGVVIAWGWGFVAPALVGAVLAILGLAVAVVSGLLERRKPLAT